MFHSTNFYFPWKCLIWVCNWPSPTTVLPLNLRIIRLTLLKKEKNNMTIWVKWAIKTLLTQPRNSTSDFKAVDQRWINADLKLKMKEISRLIFEDAKTWFNVSVRRWSKAETTLCNVNVISTVFQRGLKVSKSFIETNKASDKHGFVNR